MNERCHISILLGTLLLVLFIEPCLGAGTSKYLSYTMFKSLAALCPEVTSPHLAGLTSAGQELWSKGQMQVPVETHLFEGDFNHDGKKDVALVIASGNKNYALIAEPAGQSWRRTGFIPLLDKTITEWNQRAIAVAGGKFIAWDGKQYRLEHGPLALYCNGYSPSDFGGVSIKLTYIGPQDEPYPDLLLSSYYRFASLADFKSHRKAGVSYGNDDLPVLWHLTLSPEELRDFALALNHTNFVAAAEDRTGKEGTNRHSLSMLDASSTNRPNFYEVFLTGKETAELLNTFAKSIRSKNTDGAALLEKYSKMF